jgi:hypothetical protein
MKTIFLDFDGCIVTHSENYLNDHDKILDISNLIPGSKEKIFEWYCKGYKIIITTGRPECQRSMMTEFLAKAGIYCNQLVLDCGAGVRCLVNDIDPVKPDLIKALAFNIKRNDGLSKVEIE